MIVKNSNDLKKEYENFLPFAENCQQLSGILAPKFREHKVCLIFANSNAQWKVVVVDPFATLPFLWSLS